MIERANQGEAKLVCASELYDDIITALRSGSVKMPVAIEMLRDLRKLSHEVLPTTVDVAEEAMRIYAQHGGSRKLNYFDSFHAATANQHDLTLITSDGYMLRNADKLGIKAMDLQKI